MATSHIKAWTLSIFLLVLPSVALANSMGGSSNALGVIFLVLFKTFLVLFLLTYLVYFGLSLVVFFLPLKSGRLNTLIRICALALVLVFGMLYIVVGPLSFWFFLSNIKNFIWAPPPVESWVMGEAGIEPGLYSTPPSEYLSSAVEHAATFVGASLAFFVPAYLIIKSEWTRKKQDA